MVSSLPSISLAIWLAIALSLTLLSLVLIFSRSSARYPSFATLIYFTTCSCFTLFLVGGPETRRTYFWFYYAFLLISDILTALVAFEVYRKVFGTAMALPPTTPRRSTVNLLMVPSSWAILASLLRATVTGHLARVAGEAGPMAYLLSYLYWAWCFLGKEQPVPRTAPPELVYALAKELETLKSTRQVST